MMKIYRGECWECQHFVSTDDQEDKGKVGLCTRFPPVLLHPGKPGSTASWGFPLVEDGDSCGVFKGTQVDDFFDVYSYYHDTQEPTE